MRAILVDDESLALDFLEIQLKKVSNISIEGKFTYFDPEENKELLNQIEIAFLDIDMPNVRGIELAAEMLTINQSLLIIFVTAYNDFATEAFELTAFDYLVKPIQLDRLRKTCERIKSTFTSSISKPITDEKGFMIRIGGELTFQLSEGTVIRPEWRTNKVKELFLYLLHERGRSILKSELAELLWPDILPEISHSRLYTAIYHIRKSIAPYDKNLSLESTDEGYILHINNSSIDLVEWERQLGLYHHINSDNISAFEKAMELYSGPYLGKYHYIWAESERYRLEQLYISFALKAARYYEQLTNYQQATQWYINICNIRPDHEEAVLSLLKGLAKLDNYPLITYYYQQLEKAMKGLQLDVDEGIKNWYMNWLSQPTSNK